VHSSRGLDVDEEEDFVAFYRDYAVTDVENYGVFVGLDNNFARCHDGKKISMARQNIKLTDRIRCRH
jgi:hypothetical protein